MSKIKLTDITIDPAVGIREGTDEDTIQRYMDTFDELPPIIVYQTDHTYLLADGFHRWAAATRLGKLDIEADVRQGTHEEASEYAIYANLKHGKPLTTQEYRNAVLRLKMLHPKWGRDKISKTIMRSEGFVQFVLEELEIRQKTGRGLPIREQSVYHEIHSADEAQWQPLIEAASEQGWNRDQTREKVHEVRAEPERLDEILALEPPITREPSPAEPSDFQDLVYTMNGYFADLAEMRIKQKLTKELLSSHAPDIYTWRDAVNELIKILEG